MVCKSWHWILLKRLDSAVGGCFAIRVRKDATHDPRYVAFGSYRVERDAQTAIFEMMPDLRRFIFGK